MALRLYDKYNKVVLFLVQAAQILTEVSREEISRKGVGEMEICHAELC